MKTFIFNSAILPENCISGFMYIDGHGAWSHIGTIG